MIEIARGRLGKKKIDQLAAMIGGIFEIRTVLPDGRRVNSQKFKNGCTTLGLNYLFDTGFGGGTPDTTWFILVISEASYTSGPAPTDTLASHSGWTEWTSYTGNRPAWTNAAASGGQMTNSASAASITMSATGTIRGLGLCGVNSGSSGVLYSTGVLGTGRGVTNLEVLELVYTTILTPG